MLVEKYHKSHCKDKEILISIDKAIKSSLELRSKKELIEAFVSQMNVDTEVYKDWLKFVEKQRKQDLENIIKEENLNPEKTENLMRLAFKDGEFKTTGTGIIEIIPPTSMFGFGGDNQMAKRKSIIKKLKAFFEKYFGLVEN